MRCVCGLALVFVACSAPPPSGPDAATFVCEVTAPTSCPSPAPAYADVQPIFREHCVPCHGGVSGGPWPLTDYVHVYDWKDDIRGDLVQCSMPPYDGGTPMPPAQRDAILVWLRCGAPR